MKMKIYNFFKIFSKVSRFFSRLAVEFEIWRLIHAIADKYVAKKHSSLNLSDCLYCNPQLEMLLERWANLKKKENYITGSSE